MLPLGTVALCHMLTCGQVWGCLEGLQRRRIAADGIRVGALELDTTHGVLLPARLGRGLAVEVGRMVAQMHTVLCSCGLCWRTSSARDEWQDLGGRMQLEVPGFHNGAATAGTLH